MKKRKLLLACSLLITVYCTAQYKKLLDFNGSNGSIPTGDLILAGNSLYGTTQQGGANHDGIIFKIDTNGTGYKDLFDFNKTNGRWPSGTLLLSGSSLYGTAETGGIYDSGVIFKIDTSGSGYQILLNFNGTNGYAPYRGSLALSGNALYGMTLSGGTNRDGVIYKVNTNGSGYKKLLDFNITNGASPYGSLVLSGRVLYGMTSYGGSHGEGLAFRIDTNGTGYKDLHDFSFSAPNGFTPYGSLILSGNVLYGMTSYGGTNDSGIIFKIDTNGAGYKDLFDFNGANGAAPWGSLTLSRKILFGMTYGGGANSEGVVFKIDTNGTGYKKIFDFSGKNGALPYGSLIVSGNVLYGMTTYGGTNDSGSIFKLDTNGIAGMEEVQSQGCKTLLFPNPNNGIFQLAVGSGQLAVNSQIQIYNVLGEKVFSSMLNQSRWLSGQHDCEINLSSQPSGFYLYRVTGENGELVGEGKFVIQK